MRTIQTNRGFEGRRFLTEAEWLTYLRRKPVRYIHKPKEATCFICGNAGTAENPLQNAHRIGFDLGIVYLALTPEFLDGYENIVTAHRRECNKRAEFDLAAACRHLQSLGVSHLPEYLPSFVREAWDTETRKDSDS